MNKDYSWIYKELVTSEDDFIGAIAYSLYKRHKIEYIKQCIDEIGESPTEEQLAEFYRTSCSPTSLENYRHKADRLLSNLLHFATENIASDMQKQNKQVIHDELVELLKPIQEEIAKKKGFKQLFIEAMVSVFGAIVVIVLVGFLLRGYQWISSFDVIP